MPTGSGLLAFSILFGTWIYSIR